MGRLDTESQPTGEIGLEYIYCRVWWQDSGGAGRAVSDWRRPVLGWGRGSLQKSPLLPGLETQQARTSSGFLAPTSPPENGSICPAPKWGLLGRQRAHGTVRTVVMFSSFYPKS